MNRPHRPLPVRLGGLTAGALAAALALSGCSSATESGAATTAAAAAQGSDFYDVSLVHEIDVEFDEDDYQAMLDTYASTGEKDWIEATVTIDGRTFENVGLRFKGNSSLMGLRTDATATPADGETTTADPDGAVPGFDSGDGAADAEDPQTLPWLIRLDKDVDGQEYQGRTDFVVRGNNSETSLNEAVALYVIGQAGLATEAAALTRFSVNGGDDALRLVIESPDDEGWNDDTFDGDGITYKADSGGDYSWRGDDPASYVEAFEQKSPGGDEDYTPLVGFLDFVNNSTDEEFAAGLSEHLDVDAFATYLAVQDLVANDDDIDGPGNNSYLRYDDATGLMTVVSWDENLAYGGMAGMGGMGRGGGMPDGTAPSGMPDGMTPPDGAPTDLPSGFPTDRPDGMTPPEGMTAPDGIAAPDGGGAGFGGKTNPLVERFLANAEFSALVDQKTADLTASIYDSGDAQTYLDGLVDVLTAQAGDLVDADTVTSEADTISGYFSG